MERMAKSSLETDICFRKLSSKQSLNYNAHTSRVLIYRRRYVFTHWTCHWKGENNSYIFQNVDVVISNKGVI